MHCPNCKTEVPEGAKFCIECGTPIPQEKKCPSCGTVLPLNAKFCFECGCKLDGGTNPNAGSGISMGNKNVIAGDVIGKKEDYKISGNATIVKNEDETKKVNTCAMCGKHLTNAEGHTCPRCGRIVCDKHFDFEGNCCTECSEAEKRRSMERYREKLAEVYADGKVEMSERRELTELAERLNIPPALAEKLEVQFSGKGAGEAAFTRIENMEFEKAEKQIRDELEFGAAAETLGRIHSHHPKNEKVISLYLKALRQTDIDKAFGIAQSIPFDNEEAIVTKALYHIYRADLSRGEKELENAKQLYGSTFSVKSAETEFLEWLYYETEDEGIKKEHADSLKSLEESMERNAYSEHVLKSLKNLVGKTRCHFSVLAGFIEKADRNTDFIVAGNGSSGFEKIKSALLNVKEGLFIGLDLMNVTGITEIGEKAFSDCKSLASVEIPNSVTKIGSSAFCNCESLSSVKIPNSVTEIGDGAFEDCYSLVSVEIPNSVTEIGDGAFSRCFWLSSMEIPNSVTKIGEETFAGCSLTSVEIPDSVTKIGGKAFFSCKLLTSVEIPNSVTEIGERAFCNCKSLASVEIPNSVTVIDYGVFLGCSFLTSVEIPDSVTEIGEKAFYTCKSLTSVEIPDSVTKIGDNAFCNCESLASVEIPNSVTEIGYGAFEDCKSLTSVEISDSVTKIGRSAFQDCKSLTSVEIPYSVTEIGFWAFMGCSSLKSVVVPRNCKINDNAFHKSIEIIRR